MAEYNFYSGYTIGSDKIGRVRLRCVTSETATTVTITEYVIAQIKSSSYTLKYGYKGWAYAAGAQIGYAKESSASNSYPRTIVTASKTYAKSTSAYNVSVSGKISSQWTSTTYTATASGAVTIPALASYAVAYDANGGSGAPASQTKYYGKDITLSTTVPTWTNHTFVGWATTASATTAEYQAGDTYSDNAAVTLYAVWVLNAKVASFNANGGTCSPTSVAVTIGDNLLQENCPASATKVGYTFNSWKDSNNNLLSTYFNLPLNLDVTFYAGYTANTYPVTVETNGGSGATSFNAVYKSTVTQANFTNPTKEHYTLMGYEVYTGSSSSGELIKSFDVVDDSFSQVMDWVTSSSQTAVCLKPIWNVDAHQLIFVDGLYGINVSANNTSVDYGEVIASNEFAEFLKPTKVGYACIGWSTTNYALGTGTALTTLTITGDTTLYAVWEFIPTSPQVSNTSTKVEWVLDGTDSKVKLTANISYGKSKTGANITAHKLDITYNTSASTTTTTTVTLDGTSYTALISDIYDDATSVTVRVYQTADATKQNSFIAVLRKPYYPIDIQQGGKEIAFGAAASDDLTNHPNGLFKCGMDMQIKGIDYTISSEEYQTLLNLLGG